MRVWVCGLVLFLGVSVSYGQTQPSAAEQMLNDMLKPSAAPTPPATQPDAQVVVEPNGYKPPPAAPQLLREGSNVISRSGHLRKNSDGPYPTIVFDPKSGEAPLAPMYVLPNLQRMSMEDAASATQADLRFTVSGTVTEYKGKNYILLEPGPDEVRNMAPRAGGNADQARGPMPAEQMLTSMLNVDGPPDMPPPAATAPFRPRRRC
jgi:hypothetical protein